KDHAPHPAQDRLGRVHRTRRCHHPRRPRGGGSSDRGAPGCGRLPGLAVKERALASRDAREIYRHDPARYDELVRAEDHAGNLARALCANTSLAGATVVEVGAGTGRVTRVLLEAGAARVIAIDRERALIAFARDAL